MISSLLCLFLWRAMAAMPTAPLPKLKVVVPLEASAAFDQALTEAVKRFNSGQTKFQVELSRRGDSFQSLRSIIAAYYAGDLPDLALVNEGDLPTLISLGLAQPAPEKWLSAKKISPVFFSSTKCAGKACSIPFQRNVPVWYYNRELLFKLNQPTERIPTSWTMLSELLIRLRKTQAALPHLPTGGEGEIWALALATTGDSALARWGGIGLAPLHAPVEATVTWSGRISPTGQPEKTQWLSTLYPGRPSPTEAAQHFFEQHAVLYLGDLSQWNYLKANTNFKWGASLSEAPLAWYGLDFVFLTKERTKWSQEFLDYFYRSDVALAFFKAAPSLPVSRTFSSDPAWKKEIEGVPVVKTALQQQIRSLEIGRIAPQIREEWVRQSWQAVEQSHALELTAPLQKLLSTNPR